MSKKKPIPRFQTEEEEQEFWGERDSTNDVEWSEAPAGGDGESAAFDQDDLASPAEA